MDMSESEGERGVDGVRKRDGRVRERGERERGEREREVRERDGYRWSEKERGHCKCSPKSESNVLIDKLQLTGQNMDRAFNFRSVHSHAAH
jgi:hypothetical protein